MFKQLKKMMNKKKHKEEEATAAATIAAHELPLPVTTKKTKDDFQMVAPLGTGKFGKVVLVNHIEDGKKYAMKVVDKASVLDSGRVRDLFSERSVLKRAKHPFIVKLDYTFQSEHRLYFVMEYLPGGDLARYLDQAPGKRLTPAQGHFFASEIFLALEYLHANGIIYRDLKPENVLLDDRGHACLSDFGLSKDFETLQADARCQSFVGSPFYVAPEILRHQAYGNAVDWWSYGVLLFRMLCGVVPFNGRNVRQVFDGILFSAPNFQPYPFIEASARGLIVNLLQKEEAARFEAKHVKSHVYFRGTDWSGIYAKRGSCPDFTPMAMSPPKSMKQEQFEELASTPQTILGQSQQQLFMGFSYAGSGSGVGMMAQHLAEECAAGHHNAIHERDTPPSSPSLAVATPPHSASPLKGRADLRRRSPSPLFPITINP